MHRHNDKAKKACETTLDALRRVRDEEPELWDTLMLTGVAVPLCNAWDALREACEEEAE